MGLTLKHLRASPTRANLILSVQERGQKMNVRANLKSCLIMAMFLIAMVKGVNGYKENDWR